VTEGAEVRRKICPVFPTLHLFHISRWWTKSRRQEKLKDILFRQILLLRLKRIL